MKKTTERAETSQAPTHRWLWIASIWAGFALFDASQIVFVMRAEGMHHAWSLLFLTSSLCWLPWAIATPFILRLGHRFPPTTLRPWPTWIAHISAAILIGLAFSAWTAWLNLLFNPFANTGPFDPFRTLWFDKFFNGLLASFVLYAVILTVSYILASRARLAHHQTETARLNEQLSRAQLDALRHQIEPHFLFNTLNAIAGLVREQRNDAAVSMIAGLSDFLRRVLEHGTQQVVPLSEELDFAHKYLDIQKIRFADRLHLTVDIPGDLYGAQVPSLILQPMVENAVKHGIARRVQGGEIRIAATRLNGTLTLSVSNDGPALTDAPTHPGIGIANARTRLETLYGKSFALTLRNRETGNGVVVSVSLPFVLAPSVSQA